MGSKCIGLAMAALIVCWTSSASAQDDYLSRVEEAKKLYERAEAHYAKGEFSLALNLYERAHQRAPEPMFLLGIGQTYKALDQCDKANNYFERYLTARPDAPNRAVVEKLIQTCQERLEEKQYQAKRKQEEEARRLAAAASQPSTAPEQPGRRRLRPAWFWSTVTLSGVLLVTGAVTGGLALSKNNEYKDADTSIERRLDLRDQGKTLQWISTGTLIAGGVAAGAATLLYFYTDWHKEKTQVSAGISQGGGALFVQGTF